MAIADILADILWSLGRKASRFTRTRSEREQLEEAARWNRPHIGARRAGDRCVVCGQAVADPSARCPGTAAMQAARRKLDAER